MWAWCSKSEVLVFDSLAGSNRLMLVLHAVKDHHEDSYNGVRINQIKWYPSKLGKNFWMYDVSPFAILENELCKINIKNYWFICHDSNLQKFKVSFKIPLILWILYYMIDNFMWIRYTKIKIKTSEFW